MKEKVLQALKQAYAPLGLGDTVLSGLADMIVATTQVTDENLQGIIAGQKGFLESLQKTNDKRVQEALGKVKDEHEKAIAAKLKEIDELKAKANPTPPTPPAPTDVPDWYKREKEEREKQEKEWRDQLKALTEAKTATEAEMQKMKDEKAKAEAEQAAAQRAQLIATKALEKGIPQWMVNHGFADIPQDADDAKIDEILSSYAQEVKTNFLPGKRSFGQGNEKQASKEEAAAIAAKMLPGFGKKEV